MTISQIDIKWNNIDNYKLVQNILEHIFIRFFFFCEENLSPVVFFVSLWPPDEQ